MVHMVSVEVVSVSGTKKLHKTDCVRIYCKTQYSIERRTKFSVDAQWSTLFYSKSEHGRFGVFSLFRYGHHLKFHHMDRVKLIT